MSWVNGCIWDGEEWQPVRMFDGTNWSDGVCGPQSVEGGGDTIPLVAEPIGFGKPIELTDKTHPTTLQWPFWGAQTPQIQAVSENQAIIFWHQAGERAEDHPYGTEPYSGTYKRSTVHARLVDNSGSSPVIIDSWDYELPYQDTLMGYGRADASSLKLPGGDVMFMFMNGIYYRVGTDSSNYEISYMGAPDHDGGYNDYQDSDSSSSTGYTLNGVARFGVVNNQLVLKWFNRLGDPMDPATVGGDQLYDSALSWSSAENTAIIIGYRVFVKFDLSTGLYAYAQDINAAMNVSRVGSQVVIKGNRWAILGDIFQSPNHLPRYQIGTISPFTVDPVRYATPPFNGRNVFINQWYGPKGYKTDSDGNALLIGWSTSQPPDGDSDIFIRVFRTTLDVSGHPQILESIGSNFGWYNDASGHRASSFGWPHQLWATSTDTNYELPIIELPNGNISLAGFGYVMFTHQSLHRPKSGLVLVHDMAGADVDEVDGLSFGDWAMGGNGTAWKDDWFWTNTQHGYESEDFQCAGCWVGGKYLLAYVSWGGDNWYHGEYPISMVSVDPALITSKRGTVILPVASDVTWPGLSAPTKTGTPVHSLYELTSTASVYETADTAYGTIWSEKLTASTWYENGSVINLRKVGIPPDATITNMKLRLSAKSVTGEWPVLWTVGKDIGGVSPVVFGKYDSPDLTANMKTRPQWVYYSATEFNSLPTRDDIVNGLVQVGIRGHKDSVIGVQTKIDIDKVELVIDWAM